MRQNQITNDAARDAGQSAIGNLLAGTTGEAARKLTTTVRERVAARDAGQCELSDRTVIYCRGSRDDCEKQREFMRRHGQALAMRYAEIKPVEWQNASAATTAQTEITTETATRLWPVVSSQYGTLSRGRHSARRNGEWADKTDKGDLILTAGTWQLHCSDGYNRTARGQVTIPADGYADKECSGLSLPSRFSLVGTRKNN